MVEGREPELTIRASLGASSAVLRRSLLAQSLVLCGSGTVAAVLLAVPSDSGRIVDKPFRFRNGGENEAAGAAVAAAVAGE